MYTISAIDDVTLLQRSLPLPTYTLCNTVNMADVTEPATDVYCMDIIRARYVIIDTDGQRLNLCQVKVFSGTVLYT